MTTQASSESMETETSASDKIVENYLSLKEKWDDVLKEGEAFINLISEEFGEKEEAEGEKGEHWVVGEGKSLSQAVADGLKKMGVEEDMVDTDVIHEPLHAGDIYKVRLILKSHVDEKDMEVINVVISEDEMEAYISLRELPKFLKENVLKDDSLSISKNDILNKLSESRITHGIDMEAIEKAVEDYNNGSDIINLVVAKGKELLDGRNAVIQHHINYDHSAGEVDRLTGRIDFKERNTFTTVAKKSLLATKTPATHGEQGITVTNRLIIPQKGRDKRLTAGKNVEVVNTEEGLLNYISTVNGTPYCIGDRLEVREVVAIPGDVDYSVGNIECSGDVIIEGKVASGFKVKTDSSIHVKDLVEGATIEAGRDVFLTRGIKGQYKGIIRAKGNINATYIERAMVECMGDLHVKNVIFDSQVLCGGKVILSGGDGCIIGGKVRSSIGIWANQIGAESSRSTKIITGIDFMREMTRQKLKSEIKKCEHNLNKVDKKLKTLDSGREPGKFTTLQNTSNVLKNNLLTLQNKLVEIMSETDIIKRARIEVAKSLFPRVTIIMGHSKYTTTESHEAVSIGLDSLTNEVKVQPLTTLKRATG